MKYYKFIVSIIAISLTACELTKEIDYETLDFTSKIVVNGFISKENGLNVFVKKNVPPNTPNADDKIESPRVSLIANEQEIAILEKSNESEYILHSDANMASDILYRVKVEADGMETVISEGQQFLTKNVLDTVYLVRGSNNYANYIYLEFEDNNPPGENFYTYTVEYYNKGVTESGNTYFPPLWAYSDGGFSNNRVINFSRIFSMEFDSAKVLLYTVPKFYYDFLQSYAEYEISCQSYFFETVYPVISNIENGFGFFISYEVDAYTIKNQYKKLEYE
jgi:hypothetical protein